MMIKIRKILAFGVESNCNLCFFFFVWMRKVISFGSLVFLFVLGLKKKKLIAFLWECDCYWLASDCWCFAAADDDARLTLAHQLYKAGDFKQALEHSNLVYQRNPLRTDNLLLIGAIYYQVTTSLSLYRYVFLMNL